MNIKNQIEKNQIISQSFKKILYEEKNQIEKLKLISVFATFYWSNVVGKYRDYYLEEELDKIGKILFNTISEDSKNGRAIHIITETYEVGGHTRLLNNWIKFDEDMLGDVLVVNSNQEKVPKWLIENIKEKNGKIIFLKNIDINLKVEEMINILKNYSEIILHIHPNDIITCLALSCLNQNQRIFFVNHADHKFSLGYNYSNCVLELSKDGKEMSRLKREIKFSEVLPIPIDSNEILERNIKRYTIKKEKILVSMASEYKFLPTKKYNFQNFLDELLGENENLIFNLIGASEKNKIWEPLKRKYGNRLNLLGLLPKEETQTILKNADIYVDSFPLTSYTCILEAIDLNLPVVSLKTEVADLDCLEGIKEKKVADLIIRINNILKSEEDNSNLELKKIVRNTHSKKAWKNKLNKIRSQKYNFRNSLEKDTKYFLTDYEIFFQEISRKRIFKFSYRQFLKLKLKNKIKILMIYLRNI